MKRYCVSLLLCNFLSVTLVWIVVLTVSALQNDPEQKIEKYHEECWNIVMKNKLFINNHPLENAEHKGDSTLFTQVDCVRCCFGVTLKMMLQCQCSDFVNVRTN